MSKLLIDDYPIQVLPKLAKEIGLNEAIFLQQVHYWLNKSKHNINGTKWIYNTHEGWREQFPFLSIMTIRRTITNLKKRNLLITGNFNKAGFDKTSWYTIDYDALNCVNRRCVQNEQTMCSNRTDGSVQNEQTNTIDYTETSSETTNNNNQSHSKESDRVSLQNRFDAIWKEYPTGRKQGKESAFNSYKRAIKDGVTDETILKAINDYKQQIKLQNTDTQYIKQGGTWFNGKGWNDEYITKDKKSDKPEYTYIPPEWRGEFKDVGKVPEPKEGYDIEDLPF